MSRSFVCCRTRIKRVTVATVLLRVACKCFPFRIGYMLHDTQLPLYISTKSKFKWMAFLSYWIDSSKYATQLMGEIHQLRLLFICRNSIVSVFDVQIERFTAYNIFVFVFEQYEHLAVNMNKRVDSFHLFRWKSTTSLSQHYNYSTNQQLWHLIISIKHEKRLRGRAKLELKKKLNWSQHTHCHCRGRDLSISKEKSVRRTQHHIQC